jgi:hypothetical protein
VAALGSSTGGLPNGTGSVSGIPLGADPKGFGIGIRHSF